MAEFSFKRVGKAALLCVGIAAVLAGGKIVVDDYVINAPLRTQASQLEARQRAARAAGLFLDPKEIESARAEGLANYEAFLKFDEFIKSNKPLRVALDAGNVAEITRIVTQNETAHADLIAAAAMKEVNVPIEWGNGVSEHGPDLNVFSRYVDVLCALSKDSLDHDDLSRAAQYLTAGARVANMVQDEPCGKSLLSWTSCAYRVLRATYELVEHDSSATGLGRANDIVALLNEPTDLTSVVRNECLLFQVSTRKFDDMDYDDQMDLQLFPMTERVEPPQGRFAGRALESRSLAFWTEAVQSAVSSDGDLQTTGRYLDNLSQDWIRETDPSSYIARALSGTFEQTGVGIMRVTQMKRLISTTIEILAYRNEKGVLPRSLASDTPHHRDPLGNKPLYYRPGANGFVLQAIGEARTENVDPPVADLRLVRGQGFALTYELP